jgi:DNA-binding NarL/FixJ family response regulator
MVTTLLVDDNEVFRRALRGVLLSHFPYMLIEEAATGAEVLHQARAHRLVFMDIRLPDANGLELTRWLKVVHPDTIVCVVTQYDIPEYREAAKESGADEFMLKDSLTEAAIVKLVDSVLGSATSYGTIQSEAVRSPASESR